MKANELRIGNLVADYELNDVFFAIEEIKKNEQRKLAVYYRNGSCMSIDPEPIPLTEEWLLKFGFNQEENKYWYSNGVIAISINDKGIYVIFGNSGREITRKGLFYVHQLQNFYFCLCGKELVVSDTVS